MHAIVYTEYGLPEVLKLKEVPKPSPKHDEILIKNYASTVNYGDTIARNFSAVSPHKFTMPMLLWLPTRLVFGFRKPRKKILGNEFAGEVVEVGKDVTKFQPGDQVYGYRGQRMGCYAEYLTMPENGTVTLKPTNLTFAEATVIPYGAIMTNLLKKGNINPGSKVLINGASGGIGSASVQVAKNLGAEVTGVCGTPRLEFVKSLGADKVIDYTQEDFTQNGETYDLIFDILGKSSFRKCKNSLNQNGCYLLASFKMGDFFQMLITKLIGSKKVICTFSSESGNDLSEMKELVEVGKFKVIIDKKFLLEQTPEAHEYVESGLKKGHVVITLDHL
ncbi:MAG: NAD(P)-dependent alcohol dehydrogenase [Candidatus Thorarchaeota archaeon]